MPEHPVGPHGHSVRVSRGDDEFLADRITGQWPYEGHLDAEAVADQARLLFDGAQG
jgi:hypothetical protein